MRLLHPGFLGAIYGVSELILSFARRSGAQSESRDRNSLSLLWIVIAGSIVLALTVQGSVPEARLPHPRLFYFAGLTLFIVGIILRWYSIWMLGRFFTVDVAIAKEHRLVDSGPYRFVRHPSYTGALLAFLGFGLCLNNWLSMLCLVAPITAAFLFRIHVEERALLDALGGDYRVYTERTKRLIPFVY
jgi:protein-S-isoprenylcysteine O-methyltransferase Ste14